MHVIVHLYSKDLVEILSKANVLGTCKEVKYSSSQSSSPSPHTMQRSTCTSSDLKFPTHTVLSQNIFSCAAE